MKSNKIMWGVVSLVVLITGAVSFGAFESNGLEDRLPQPEITPTVTPWPEVKDTRDLSKYGSVEYSKAPEDVSEARIFANKRYDNQGWVFESVHPVTAGVGRVTEDPPPPLFPVDDSTLIVVGEVIKTSAFLSNDKKCVYTEFTIQVDDVLKNSDLGKSGLKKVIADREGGVVVYSGGQRVMYHGSDRGLPQLGSKYLFFLKKDGPSPNYEVITSYDVTRNRIYQMEKGRNFDEFKSSDKTAFIEIVRNKISHSPGQ